MNAQYLLDGVDAHVLFVLKVAHKKNLLKENKLEPGFKHQFAFCLPTHKIILILDIQQGIK